ncbi:MAG: hypothetical protein JST84_25955 [Acidobacteria bacterium]|nr:hypothetical protein [Acidobacteriota bacterium]
MAKTKGKPKVAASLADSLASAFDKISLAVTMYQAASSFKKDEKWQVAGAVGSEILESFVRTPTGALILTNVNLFAANLYGGSMLAFKQRVNQITNRTESDLRSIATISGMMKEDTAQLSMARQQLEAANTIVQSSNCMPASQPPTVTTSSVEGCGYIKNIDRSIASDEATLRNAAKLGLSQATIEAIKQSIVIQRKWRQEEVENHRKGGKCIW